MSGVSHKTTPLNAAALVDALPQLLWSADADGRADYFHPKLLQYVGAEAEDLTGDRWLDRIHPEDRERTRDWWLSSRERCDLRLRRHDGAYVWHLATGEPLQDGGAVVRWVVTLTEIDRFKAYEAEREAFLNSIADGFLALDRNLRFTYVNKEAERLVGSTSAELIGRRIADVYPELVGSPLYAEYERVLCERTSSEVDNFYEPWQRWFRVRIFPSTDGGLTVYFRDITEEKRRRTEEAAANAVVDAMFANAPVGLALWDREMRYVRLNEALAKLNGMPVEAHLGRRASEILPGVPVEAEANRRKVLATGIPLLNVEVRGSTPAGEGIRDWLSSYYPVRVDDEIVGVGAFIIDVTDLKKAQQALLETERQFRVLADSIPALCWMANADGHIFWYNQRWYEYSGTTQEEMEGWGWQKIHDPAVLPEVMEEWRKSLATGMPFEMTFPLRGADGAFRPFLTRIIPVRDSRGEIVRWFGANTDVTAAKRTEDALRRSELRLRRIIDSGVIGVLFWKTSGRITDSNDKFLQMVGYSRDELCSGALEWNRMTPPEWRPLDEACLQRLRSGGVAPMYEKQFLRKDGSRVPVILGAAMLGEEDGVACVMDITSLKLVQDELRRSNEDLQQFAWAASHDLQEPLRMVTAYTQLLTRRRADQLDAEARMWMEQTVRGARRVEALLRDLREYWRVTDRPADPPEIVDTDACLAHALSLLEALTAEANGTIVLEPLPRVLAHQTPVTLLFQNLISNALKYRRPEWPPEVRISVETNDGMHEFAVSDNGVGIAPAYQTRVFGIFKRLHRHADIPGTGMGLAICKRIVERYGGTLRVDSVLGEGSTFRFTLPAAP